jgi:hypothetical protein
MTTVAGRYTYFTGLMHPKYVIAGTPQIDTAKATLLDNFRATMAVHQTAYTAAYYKQEMAASAPAPLVPDTTATTSAAWLSPAAWYDWASSGGSGGSSSMHAAAASAAATRAAAVSKWEINAHLYMSAAAAAAEAEAAVPPPEDVEAARWMGQSSGFADIRSYLVRIMREEARGLLSQLMGAAPNTSLGCQPVSFGCLHSPSPPLTLLRHSPTQWHPPHTQREVMRSPLPSGSAHGRSWECCQ